MSVTTITRYPKLWQSLKAFSLYTNTRQLLSTGSQSAGDSQAFASLHGIRLITLVLTIYCHTCYLYSLIAANVYNVQVLDKTFWQHFTTNATQWIDTLFLVSGFLHAYNVLQTSWSTSSMRKTDNWFGNWWCYQYLLIVFKRYVRLTPSVLAYIAGLVLLEHYWFNQLTHTDMIYSKIVGHIGPYCVGIITAYLYEKYKHSFKISKKLNIILWTVCVTVNIAIISVGYLWILGYSYRNWLSVAYGAINRTLWSVCWAYMLFACMTGYGHIVQRVLAWPPLVPLSRLTFQANLYHALKLILNY
ncbi:uncharacterized protein LOC128951443 [Oppia nitens]|uniref:uncharacterized protein LOC128951443 n=1 Tax=Oppia nitens TaxID=1686743 RepID=UPI0023DBB44A|nr:uncharacterized protein LOC128951443 [Oppia nitens]